MNIPSKNCYATRPAWSHCVEVGFALPSSQNGKVAVAKPLVFEDISEGEFAEPTLRLTPEEAQRLVDALWACGVRPSEGTGSAGSLAATQKHLDDMRAIASHTLGVKL